MTLEERHTALVAYLLMKVEEKDWHGVSDAANDLRVLEAQMGTAGAILITKDALRRAVDKELTPCDAVEMTECVWYTLTSGVK